jgi:hypothetical protein
MMIRSVVLGFLTVVLLLVAQLTGPATLLVAQAEQAAANADDPPPTDDGDMPPPPIKFTNESSARLGGILLLVLALSIAFELALTTIFNWRIFKEHLDKRGFKTPIAVGIALAAFWQYDIDIFRDIFNSLMMGNQVEGSFWGKVLSALLIAGGSSTVYELLTRFGLRVEDEDRKKEPAETALSTGGGLPEQTTA